MSQRAVGARLGDARAGSEVGRATGRRVDEHFAVDGWDERWNRADDDCIVSLCVVFLPLIPARDMLDITCDHDRICS